MSAAVSTPYAAPRTGAAESKLPVIACVGLIAGMSIGLWLVIGRVVIVVAAQF